MVERERRLLGIHPPSPLDDPEPTPSPLVEPEIVDESEQSDEERSNLKLLAKEKLEELNRYVIHHIFRRLRAKWPRLREMFMEKQDPQIISGSSRKSLRRMSTRMTSMKPKLPLSSLVEIFVSPEIQIDFKDARKIFDEMEIDEKQVAFACKIYAANLENQIFDDVEFNFLLQIREDRIPESRLMNALFSVDPIKRSLELQQAEADYALSIQFDNEKLRKIRLLEEKSNARTLKNRKMFEVAISELQPIKGPLNEVRLNRLFNTYMGCLEITYQQRVHEARLITQKHLNIVSLLGDEWFSDRYLNWVRSPPFLQFEYPVDVTPNSSKVHVISLHGPPSFVNICRQLIQQGKGLHGLSYYEVAELLQALAATKIQTFFRMYLRHWRYSRACKKWSLRFKKIKHGYLSAWYVYTKMILRLRRACLRKIVAWKFYTKENIRRRILYSHCFWPLYVWRRYSIRTRTIKEKTKFLCSRVYPTYIKLRNFRAWKNLVWQLAKINKLVDGKYRTHLEKLKVEYFNWLRRWTRERLELRRSWVKAKIYDTRNKILMYKLSYFQIWKGYSMYRTVVQLRVKANLQGFRKALMRGAPPRDYYEIFRNEHIAIARRKMFKREILERKNLLKIKRKQQMANDEGANFTFAVNNDKMESQSDIDSNDFSESEQLELENYRAHSAFHRTERHMVQSTWRAYRSPDMYDIDTEGEFSEIPNSVRLIYNDCVPPLSEIIDEHTQRWGSPFVKLKYSHLVHNFSNVEAWAFLEEAMLFHRVASKAFRNLQIFAIVRIRARRAWSKYRLGLLRKVFQALYEWMHRTEVVDNSEAEALALEARTARLNRLQQRRQIQKSAIQKIDNDGVLVSP